MREAERWNAHINRLYYACFYAITAVLAQHELFPKTHAGVRATFNRRLVAPGTVPKSMARLYNDLFDYRQRGDYEDFFRADVTLVRPWQEQAAQFVRRMGVLAADS